MTAYTQRAYEPVVVFDLLDTIQTYRGAAGSAKDHYMEATAHSFGLTVDDMKKTKKSGKHLDYLDRTADLIEDGTLEPEMVEGAGDLVQRVKETYGGARAVIVTGDYEKGARLAAHPLVKAGIVDSQDVYAVQDIGDKKNPETWRKAQQKSFPNNKVVAVVEDGEDNLEAAMEGYECDGVLVKQSGGKYVNEQPISYAAQKTRKEAKEGEKREEAEEKA